MVTWTKEQREAIERKGSNILVAAAAGSGKTAVLVERIIQKLMDVEDPLNIDEILVATFTNAAAEEMRNRIGVALEDAIAKDPTSYHLKKQLSLLQRASISTLHSFCTTVVRQYAYLLDIDPSFRIADEMEIDLIKQEVIDEMFEDAYGAEEEELDRFFTVVDMFSSDRSDVEVEKLVLTLYTFAMQHPWPEQWLNGVAESYHIEENCSEDELPWLTILKEEVKDQLYSFRSEILWAIDIARESDGPYHYLDALEADMNVIDHAIEHAHLWEDLQQSIVSSRLKSLSRKRVECNEDKKEKVQKVRSRFREQWNKMKKNWFSRNIAAHLEDMRLLFPAIKRVTELVIEFKERFSTVKREKAIVDFLDLEHFCLAILIEPTSTLEQIIPSDIAYYYKNQFKEVLVDEYQDINIVQETILSVVSDDTKRGNMFMVGDVKQSIYRFRHAEPTLFIEKYKRFREDESHGKRIDLAKNFRSREEILTGANYIFKQIFDESLGEIEYDTAAELIYGNTSYDNVPIENPETELLIIDRDTEEKEEQTEGESVEDLEATQLEARLYAEKIKEWIGTKDKAPMQVIDKATNKKRNIQYRDIVILQRSLTGAPTIVDELKKQGIPVYAELRTGYFVAIEIQVMINMLKIIDNPYQDIPLASVLRSPIVGLNEEQLTQIRLTKRYESFYVALKRYAKDNQDGSILVQHFLDQHKKFRQLTKEGALSELIWQIYRDTGYYDFVGGIPGGRQRQANLRALYDRARGYESTSFRGLFRFLRFIERMQEQNKDLGEARALSEQEDVVRIMTIHKSKGLEFPVVIIGGMNKEFNFSDIRAKYILDKDQGFATKFIDPVKRITYPTLYYVSLQQESLRKLLAEEMRVLYVAMTRAKEKLVMIGNVASFEKKQEKWLQITDHLDWILPKQLRKEAKTYLDWVGPALIRHHQSSLLLGEEELAVDMPDEIRKDPSQWKLDIVSATKLTNINAQVEETKEKLKNTIIHWENALHANPVFEKEVEERLSFQYTFQEATEARAKQSVTEIKRRQELADVYSDQQLTLPFRAPLRQRPSFMQVEKTLTAAEIGTAMHTVMQHLPISRPLSKEDIKEYVSIFVGEEKITEKEAEVIDLDAIEHFYSTDLAKRMFRSENVEREVPFTYTLEASEVYPNWSSETNEKVLLQGVIDCIIYTDKGAIILDYKTDKITDEMITDELITKLKARYKIQINLYKQALEDILQQKVSESYLYFFSRDLLIKCE
ncbi:helicase-exonuclease AddAB subunit AddA [Pseudogracilibacillus auburnensis]|uniref:helicase-exonuclease AddAB subunit AddA n=1 Tax=Pseudogracilibacillus auburnensis TaxID=1494959 RepID=UPI001A975BE9|nr:helicase-exonuclease AddAB subunit AddA [Pseudogracilibacillus auburnensis]MBO1002959.1 helicase-exonuclease AddAB subunit AddA [Pseudogracilibacillus auburnensis]